VTREILVVDDDFSAREVLTELLRDHGYSVISAADGREALNYLQVASPPGIIVLDLMMPVMDGWEFLQHQSHDPALRGHSCHSHRPRRRRDILSV